LNHSFEISCNSGFSSHFRIIYHRDVSEFVTKQLPWDLAVSFRFFSVRFEDAFTSEVPPILATISKGAFPVLFMGGRAGGAGLMGLKSQHATHGRETIVTTTIQNENHGDGHSAPS
jgi:hypothetical protein